MILQAFSFLLSTSFLRQDVDVKCLMVDYLSRWLKGVWRGKRLCHYSRLGLRSVLHGTQTSETLLLNKKSKLLQRNEEKKKKRKRLHDKIDKFTEFIY